MRLSRPLALVFLALTVAVACGLAPARAADGPPRLLMVGDSTMASYEKPPPDRPGLTGWGQVFGEFFVPGIPVNNRAQSGASSRSFIRSGLWGKALEAGGDYVFIQFAHNDQHVNDPRSTDPASDYREYLRQYVEEARARGMRPILVTPVARRTYANGQAVSTLTPYVEAMKAVAKERGTPLVDLHAASLALFNRLGEAGSADLSASRSDRTHFSRKGGRAIAALVADALPVSVPELRPFLRVRPRLTLPPVLYAVPGVETAVYFANAALFKESDQYRFRVKSPVGKADASRWVFTPRPDEVGDHLLRLEALDAGGKPVEEASCRVRVAAQKSGAGKAVTLLLVGDSLTHGALYPNELARLLSGPGKPAWKMLGTHRPDNAATGVAHEGYGGWSWERFARRCEAGSPATGIGRNSPFVFPSPDGGAPVLDVARYFHEQCGDRRPDTVIFMLGINDGFGLDPDDPAALDGGIDWVLQQAETLLAAFRKAAPDAELGVCLTTPPNSRDAAFEAIYKGRFPRWGWRRIQHRLVEREIAQFGGREKERIFLVPTELNLDPVGGYPDYSDVHPNAAGYRQVGASVYAWLEARLQARAGP